MALLSDDKKLHNILMFNFVMNWRWYIAIGATTYLMSTLQVAQRTAKVSSLLELSQKSPHLTLSKFIVPAETFRLSSISSVCYIIFQFGKVIGNKRNDEQKYIVYFCIENFYLLAAKIIHLWK